MAPRKRRGPAKTSRSSRITQDPTPPDPYQSLVAEYLAAEGASVADDDGYDTGRSSKRRRVGERTTDDESVKSARQPKQREERLSKPQVAYEDFEDDESDEDSDDDFEDVDLTAAARPRAAPKPSEDLDLVLGGDETDKKTIRRLSALRRQTLTSAHRKLRIHLHKLHVLALIAHVRLRNEWCNDPGVQTKLRGIITPAIRKMLRDDSTQTQWQRSRSLKMGLEKSMETFRERFDISARGLQRSYWSDLEAEGQMDRMPTDIDLPITKEDFCELANKMSGSRDVGAQLFCAALRALNLDVRLVCSLQPLPLQASMNSATPSKPTPAIVPFHDTRTNINSSPTTTRNSAASRNNPNAVSSGVRRFGHAASNAEHIVTVASPSHSPQKKKRIRESPYPVYWVEVFNVADQKWIPVDPLVLKLIDKPSKFEPPASDNENNISYVIAVDEEGFIKDVTRRYAHAYNAKTRRNRIEATREGQKWWKRVLRIYRDPLPQDRDQVENSELAAKEAREPMPRSIVEFKNHPYYALERHLRQNEVLHPKRQVGTVSAGVNKPLESIYRRQDVHLVRSADAWFRHGQQVKLNEEPLKFLEAKKSQKQRSKEEENLDDEPELNGMATGSPLYAAYQTQQYIPPPIIAGIVPKNIYGNIDIYTTSMIPAGGVWINHPFAVGAAKLLTVDWADAVTGFEFRGRTGTAVIKGIVVAGEYHEAIVETIKSIQYAFEQEEITKRSAQVLFTWKRFLLALRIRERIKNYHVEGEDLEKAAQAEDDGSEGSEYKDTNEVGGGFLPGEHQDEDFGNESMPSLPQFRNVEAEPLSKALEDSMAPILSTWGERLPALPPADISLPASEHFMQPLPNNTGDSIMTDDIGGGFVPENEDLGGGFFPEDDQASGHGALDDDDDQTETVEGEISQDEGMAAKSNVSTVEDFSIEPDSLQMESAERNSIPPTSTPQANNAVEADQVKMEEAPPQDLAEEDDQRKASEALPSTQSSKSTESAGSLLSHDPEDEDAEVDWL